MPRPIRAPLRTSPSNGCRVRRGVVAVPHGGRSAAAHCQADVGLKSTAGFGRTSGRRRAGRDIAAGDVECGEGGFGVLRQTAAAGFDEARDRLAGARRAGLAQHLGTAPQLRRQHDESAVDVDPRAEDLDRPGDAELRARRDAAVRRRDELIGRDRDVAAIAGLAF